MPILNHAKKKLRADKKKAEINKKLRTKTKRVIRDFRLKPTVEGLAEVYSTLDRSVKKKYFKKGKADRLKSRLTKLVKPTKSKLKK